MCDATEPNRTMTAKSITPLGKLKPDGSAYVRLPQVNAKLLEINTLTRDALAERCKIRDDKDPGFIPSECLVYLVREHRTSPTDVCSEVLYETLLRRVSNSLPSGESLDGEKEKVFESDVRDRGRYRFTEMLMRDRANYEENLDVYEVRFAMAMATLRLDARRWAKKRFRGRESIEIDPETGELSPEAEEAAGGFEPCNIDEMDVKIYRPRLNAAIDNLPDLQKAIIEMDQKGIPTESIELGVVTISATLEKTPKTIRAHRAMAIVTLRAALMKGETR